MAESSRIRIQYLAWVPLGLNTENSFDYTEYKSKRRLGNFTEKRLLVSNKFENRLP